MADYISREAAIAEVEEWHDMYPDSDAAREALSLVKRAIRKLPAADVRPVVRGKWQYNPGDNIPYCSECMMPQDSECNFCPNCGADMREES